MMSRLWPLLPFLILGTGCVSMAPKYVAPAPPIPAQWPESAASAGQKPVPALAWQDFYADPQLNKVLRLALANNRDYRIAILNTEKAQAYYRIQRAELVPSINVVGVGSKQRVPASLSSTGSAVVAETYAVNAGVSSWELDFFGRVRSLKNRALEQFLASEQARDAAQVALLAETANGYLTLAADEESLALSRATLTSQEASYKLIQRRFEVGASSELDARRAEVSMETARGEVARYTRAVALDENALNLLVGSVVPAELRPKALGSVTALKDITAGLPSEVLMRRPDLLMAESQLRAANANIGAARAAFFPRISLTTNLGTMDRELSGLFGSGSQAWSFAPQIVLPIFNLGATRASLKVAKADREIYLAQYEKAIQGAFREVSDTLVARGTLEDQLTAQLALTKALEATSRLGKLRYEAGIDSYLGVLDAERSLFAAQQGLIALRRAKYGNLVTLYKVLGGGPKAD